ncbi:hypothetical protein [Pseudoalteromonas rubra]|uniref:Uncharacterized protein n=1 Tax=Pseudoalteromonas rubra TaxID=43658 RepID=A0A0U3GI65_9GAMM|nr:hypothetical protein [Pseudoalteromonas rubra]ALU44570.1 hypothetical protein AT705_17495 [Pseudoalteromonas rubra]
MNIESLSRLIEAADVSVFRSIATIIMPLFKLPNADYCDGPYDGGHDFKIVNMPNGTEVGIQISVEKKWEPKLRSDAKKLKHTSDVDIMYFFSSRRIPEGSYKEVEEDIFTEHAVTVRKYDCQAIASRLVKHDKVSEVLVLFGIKITKPEQKYLTPKNEAVSSLLLFDQKTKDLRQRFFQSIIMSTLSRKPNGCSREQLIESVTESFNLEETQQIQLNANIDRLLQNSEIESHQKVLILSKSEQDRFAGLQKTTELELEMLKSDFKDKLSNLKVTLDAKTQALLLDNFIELTIYLSGQSYNIYDAVIEADSSYKSIRDIISSKFGQQNTHEIFKELSSFFAGTDFAKHIACAKLYDAFLNTNSSHLINALGGVEALNVYIDASVFIPIICGLLFDNVGDRNSLSGASLHKLITKHEFNAIIPHDYMEEVASHLIEACRDYKHIVEKGIELSHSGNAFISHYSRYRRSRPDITFSEYVKLFGVRLNTISSDMSDSAFYLIRDRAVRELEKLASKYSFKTERFKVEYLESKIDELKLFVEEQGISRPDVLIRHDAKVIEYLAGGYIESGIVKLLCTWDKVHSLKNPEGADGYYVMHPVAVIDYLSLAKGNGDVSVSHLLDFAAMQEEADLKLSSQIWDVIAKVDNDNLADAELFGQAREFQEAYMNKHANDESVANEQVEKEWMAWKK